jgi:hypothetical protein
MLRTRFSCISFSFCLLVCSCDDSKDMDNGPTTSESDPSADGESDNDSAEDQPAGKGGAGGRAGMEAESDGKAGSGGADNEAGHAGDGSDAGGGTGGGGSGGRGSRGGTGGSSGSSGSTGSEVAAGAGGRAGSGGSSGAGAAAAGASGSNASDCGNAGQACCPGEACHDGLDCRAGSMCSCAKDLFGHYVLRNDSQLIYQSDPPATQQTVVLDATTGTPLANVTAAAEGPAHACALLGADKSVWCWRSIASGNAVGQLGNGTMDATGPLFRASRVLTATNQPLEGVVRLADTSASTGGSNMCAVTEAGKIYCWGTLSFLFNDGTAKLNSPYAIAITKDGVTELTGVLEVSMDNTYACALIPSGAEKTVWCWGTNAFGNLGTGDTTFQQYPRQVLGLSDPKQVLAFGYAGNTYYNNGTTCVLEADKVRCWGSNNVGQIGNGMTSASVLVPTSVNVMGTNTPLDKIVRLTAGSRVPNGGYQDVCALTSEHKVFCWGSPFENYPTVYPTTNIQVVGGLSENATRFLTLDGQYHFVTNNNATMVTRTITCAPTP